MELLKVVVLSKYEGYQDVIEFFTYKFPDLFAEYLYQNGGDKWTIDEKDLWEMINIEELQDLRVCDIVLIMKAVGFKVYESPYTASITLSF